MSRLSSIDTRAPNDINKSELKPKLKALTKELKNLQAVLFAQKKYSVLIVLQGMDASGKDGTVRAVFSGVNPIGCRVKAFKKPTDKEFAHDFLWRVHEHTPEKGMIQIFNRSHYEDILVPSVNKYLPGDFIEKRYRHINDFEKLLEDSGCTILKFYLHTSKEEQAERFQDRLTDPYKHWKYNAKDLEVAKQWDDYMNVYKSIIERCSPEIPWHIIPADQNWYRNYLVATEIVSALRKLDLKYPELNE